MISLIAPAKKAIPEVPLNKEHLKQQKVISRSDIESSLTRIDNRMRSIENGLILCMVLLGLVAIATIGETLAR